jgi:hypothetical protein
MVEQKSNKKCEVDTLPTVGSASIFSQQNGGGVLRDLSQLGQCQTLRDGDIVVIGKEHLEAVADQERSGPVHSDFQMAHSGWPQSRLP